MRTTTFLLAGIAVIVIGAAIVTLIAYLYPERITKLDGTFRYDVATLVVAAWPLSVLVFAVWSLTWPARKLTEKSRV